MLGSRGAATVDDMMVLKLFARLLDLEFGLIFVIRQAVSKFVLANVNSVVIDYVQWFRLCAVWLSCSETTLMYFPFPFSA